MLKVLGISIKQEKDINQTQIEIKSPVCRSHAILKILFARKPLYLIDTYNQVEGYS